VISVMYLGDHSEVRLELPGGARLLATVRGAVTLGRGDVVTARLPPDAFLEVR
jgi:hypothetical protein